MSLKNVSPVSTPHNVANSARVNMVAGRNAFLGLAESRTPSDLRNIGGGKFFHSHSFPDWMFEPTLCAHVIHVVLVGSGKEMSGIKAFPVVTFMQDMKTRWNGSDDLLIDHAMCQSRRPASKPNHCISIAMDHSVSFDAGIFVCRESLPSTCDNIESSVIFTDLAHDSFYHREAA